jgi:hypothetical protein
MKNARKQHSSTSILCYDTKLHIIAIYIKICCQWEIVSVKIACRNELHKNKLVFSRLAAERRKVALQH